MENSQVFVNWLLVLVTHTHILDSTSILATMKLVIILTVLLVLLGNANMSKDLARYQKLANRLMFTSTIRISPILSKLKKNHQRKPKGISPTLELRSAVNSKKNKIKVCQNGLILNNVRRWRKYCPGEITYGRM